MRPQRCRSSAAGPVYPARRVVRRCAAARRRWLPTAAAARAASNCAAVVPQLPYMRCRWCAAHPVDFRGTPARNLVISMRGRGYFACLVAAATKRSS